MVSGVTATMLSFSMETAEPSTTTNIVGYFAVGVAGGLLPDIDSETSIPLRVSQRIVATIGTLLIVVGFAPTFSLPELGLIAIGAYTLFEAGFAMFGRATSHRGLVHSLPSAACFALSAGLIGHHVFGTTPVQSWFNALFLAVGFVTHLVLDELYSVNLLGARLKKSFGSALSFGDASNPLGTAALYGGAVMLFLASPPIDDFQALFSDADTYSSVVDRLWPDGPWFR